MGSIPIVSTTKVQVTGLRLVGRPLERAVFGDGTELKEFLLEDLNPDLLRA